MNVPVLSAIGLVCCCLLILFTAGPAHASEQLKDDIVLWEVRDEKLWLVKVVDNPCGDDHRAIPLNLIVPNAGSTPLPARWITGQLLVGYDGFIENQNPRLNYKRYLMLTVENGRITKREFQDRKLWDQ